MLRWIRVGILMFNFKLHTKWKLFLVMLTA